MQAGNDTLDITYSKNRLPFAKILTSIQHKNGKYSIFAHCVTSIRWTRAFRRNLPSKRVPECRNETSTTHPKKIGNTSQETKHSRVMSLPPLKTMIDCKGCLQTNLINTSIKPTQQICDIFFQSSVYRITCLCELVYLITKRGIRILEHERSCRLCQSIQVTP